MRSRSVGDRNRTRAGWRVTGKLGGEKKSFDPALPSQESNLHCGDTGAAAWYALHVACEVLSPATSRLVLHRIGWAPLHHCPEDGQHSPGQKGEMVAPQDRVGHRDSEHSEKGDIANFLKQGPARISE